LLDRIDIHVELAALPADHLLADASAAGEPSQAVSQRVAAARCLQLQRQGKLNARLTAAETERICVLERAARALLGGAIARLGLSARAYHRVLKLARSCADLAASGDIAPVHLAEAVQLRALDRAPPGGRRDRPSYLLSDTM
jgi:magnesium chelatase family protein